MPRVRSALISSTSGSPLWPVGLPPKATAQVQSLAGGANPHRSTNTTTTVPAAFAPARPLAQEVSAAVVVQPRGVVSNQANSGCRTGLSDLHSGQGLPSQESQQPLGKAAPAGRLAETVTLCLA